MFKKNNFSKGRGRDNRGGGQLEMHRTDCARCGDSCSVPFKPNGSRPVFCSDCFKIQDNNHAGDFDGDDSDKKFHRADCRTCGNSCTVPFKPMAGRPIYCLDCLDKRDGHVAKRSGGISIEQFNILDNKLDKVLKLLKDSRAHALGMDEEVNYEPGERSTRGKKDKGYRGKY
jgi:CxxC-x17-CxxC domain-containing protein